MSIIKILFAIFLPPVGAFLQVGFSFHFFMNILLTIFGYLPGCIHALWLMVKNKQD